jgi:hypothetical protein
VRVVTWRSACIRSSVVNRFFYCVILHIRKLKLILQLYIVRGDVECNLCCTGRMHVNSMYGREFKIALCIL